MLNHEQVNACTDGAFCDVLSIAAALDRGDLTVYEYTERVDSVFTGVVRKAEAVVRDEIANEFKKLRDELDIVRAGYNAARLEIESLRATEQPRTIDVTKEREKFESVFKLPRSIMVRGNGYAPTSYNAWDAHTFIARWEGWCARAVNRGNES